MKIQFSRKIIHSDAFRSLTGGAQWLYFSRKLHRQKTRFTPEETMTWASDITYEDAIAFAKELRNSPFKHVLNKRTTKRKKISLELRREVYASDGWACVQCGTNKDLEIDHIIPLSRGGTDGRDNLQTLCAHHNRKKGVRIDGLVQS